MKLLPPKFEESISRQLGGHFTEFLASIQEPPPVSIRTHPLKGFRTPTRQPVPWSTRGEYLGSRPVFTLDPLFHGGSYYVQEASSMFLEQALKQVMDADKSIRILDLCAAPGGKSTHILSLISRQSLLVSNDAIRSRASILSENIQKWGYPNAVVTNSDPSDFRKLSSFFDVVVVDAPCSGEGLFRRDPDAMNEWSPENVQLCAARQKRILSDVWDALREDGFLIYSTCTYNTLENEENLKWLKENHRVEFLQIPLDPSWGIQEVNDGKVKGYRFYPHRTRGEGFFLSLMRKQEPSPQPATRARKKMAVPTRKIQERLSEWIVPDRDNFLVQFNDLIFYTPSFFADAMESLLQNLKVVYAGTNLATLKHDKLIPEHALSLSVELNKDIFPVIEVSEEDALRYLRKEAIQLPDAAVGFSLLTFKGTALGWANVLSNRVNNMYPSDWRIRMGGSGK